jgi:hypothetical protein
MLKSEANVKVRQGQNYIKLKILDQSGVQLKGIESQRTKHTPP